MIGIFDSGVGGLTVMKEIVKLLPEYDYLYLGDTARVPYGNRSAETVRQFSEEAVRWMFDQGVKLIIIACNTASSSALRYLQDKYLVDRGVMDRKILGVIRPTVEEAIRLGCQRVCVVGTAGTVRAGAYEKEFEKLGSKAKVYSYACPLLVPLIEENWHNKPEARMILKKYLRPVKSCNPEALILGCTHYPLMMRDFKRLMGKRVKIISSAEETAKKLVDYLKRHSEIEKLLRKERRRLFYATDDSPGFKSFAERVIGKIGKINLAEIGK
ncbi:glutamate racemase [Candidatus Peregrinibacteria bacterium]|nr:glutamate racemase [Candidatus Peregrinibacteria bacterium]